MIWIFNRVFTCLVFFDWLMSETCAKVMIGARFVPTTGILATLKTTRALSGILDFEGVDRIGRWDGNEETDWIRKTRERRKWGEYQFSYFQWFRNWQVWSRAGLMKGHDHLWPWSAGLWNGLALVRSAPICLFLLFVFYSHCPTRQIAYFFDRRNLSLYRNCWSQIWRPWSTGHFGLLDRTKLRACIWICFEKHVNLLS